MSPLLSSTFQDSPVYSSTFQACANPVTIILHFLVVLLELCNCSMFCCTLLYVHSSIAIILMGKRELIALLNLSSWCLVMVERLFLAVPQGCLQFVIVVFPDHTHLLFLVRFPCGGGGGHSSCNASLGQLNVQWSDKQQSPCEGGGWGLKI